MLPFDDPQWPSLLSGYHRPFDARPAIQAVAEGKTVAGYRSLWDELHHQGEIDTAAYATIPHLVRIHRERGTPEWNTFALAATVECGRGRPGSAALPEQLLIAYERAWIDLPNLALRDLSSSNDTLVVRSAVSVLLLARGSRAHGELVLQLTDDEARELLDEHT